jgi:hypothetical protein
VRDAPLVLHALARERALQARAEEFVRGRLVELAQRPAEDRLGREAQPGRGLPGDETNALFGVDEGDDRTRAPREGGKEFAGGAERFGQRMGRKGAG